MNDVPVQIVNTPMLDIGYYLEQIINFFVSHYPAFFDGSKSVIGFLIGLSIPISFIFFIGIILAVERLKMIRIKEEEIYNPKIEMGYSNVVPEQSKGNPDMAHRWDRVTTLIESQNQNDWRQAIIEADIILGELLTKLGYQGEGIGEQLRRVEKGDFKTLIEAWEAHKIRNEIAHSGSDYSFSQHDAKRVIHLYRKVFEEFFYI